jgi:hypothetical protein
VAALCKKVLEGRDGLMSGISFLDHVEVFVPANHDPETRVPVPLYALIGFKAELFEEREYVLRLVMHTPTRKRRVIGDNVLRVDAAGKTSVSFRVKLDLMLKSQGLFWIDVIFDGKRYTRMPLWVRFIESESDTAEQPTSTN